MNDPVLDRLRDRLAINPPYEGVVAEGYDAWVSVDDPLPEEARLDELLADTRGPILELGCGTGRPLLRWLAEGRTVEGIDASADMLAILRRHAADRDLDPVLHRGDFAPLALGRRYAAIVCPAGTFMLVDDPARARAALGSYLDHLEPGGRLALSLAGPDPQGEPLTWRVRRTGTTATGTTVVVHQAAHELTDDQLEVVYNRVEAYDPSGRLQDTWLRRHHLRWWARSSFESMLVEAGFVDVESPGDERSWVATGRRPR